MKKLLGILFIGIFLISNNTEAKIKNFVIGDTLNDYLIINKNFKVKLTSGNWEVVRKQTYHWQSIKQKIIGIGKIENNELMELIEVYEGVLFGGYISDVDPIITELVFHDEHDGCYERPEYYLVELYRRGNTHNCMVIGHVDVLKELKYPDDTTRGKAAAAAYNYWLDGKTEINIPKIMLGSLHSYFSRTTGSKWYQLRYFINPKLLNAPEVNFFSEESSEYHKHNINSFPNHKKIMEKWVSISSQRQKEFENISRAKANHKLRLDKYIFDNEVDLNSNKNIVNELNALNELYKSGVLTKEEFEKAKKKLLN